jgi:hypothetical protein
MKRVRRKASLVFRHAQCAWARTAQSLGVSGRNIMPKWGMVCASSLH